MDSKSKHFWYEEQLIDRNKDKNVEDHEARQEDRGKILDDLQKNKKGRIRYETGWDTQPYSVLKLISDVQAESHNHTYRNIERAAQILRQSPSPGKDEYRGNRKSGAGSRSYDELDSFHTANNTFTSPRTERSSSTLKTPKSGQSPRRSYLNNSFGIREEDEFEADELAISTRSPIFSQFERATAEYEKGRIYSWLDKCRDKVAEFEALEEKSEEGRRNLAEAFEREQEKRKKTAAAENKEKLLSLEFMIAEQRRSVELQNEMQEKEFVRLREQAEKARRDILEEQRKKKEEEAAAAAKRLAEQEEEIAKEKEKALAKNVQVSETTAVVADENQKPEDKPKQTQVPSEFKGAVLEKDLIKYLKTQELLEQIKGKIAHISSSSKDTNTKLFHSNAMKVISTPLNSISLETQQSKLTHFVNLLDGKSVYAENSPFNSSNATNGNLFVLNMLAYRFIKKSETDIGVEKSDRLVPIATLGVQLVQRYPNWGSILRAYFYKVCPFLVPFSYPKGNMTLEEYAFAIGLELKGNDKQVQNDLIARIKGYCTLYALMVLKFEEHANDGSSESNCFFTLAEIWRILVATLKCEPQPHVTAIVFRTLLEITGDKLAAQYRFQFRKFLQVLLSLYLPKMSSVTPPAMSSSLNRLKIFLETNAPTWFRQR